MDKIMEDHLKKQNKILEKWLIKNYGKRCLDYERECIVCKKLRLFDKLVLE